MVFFISAIYNITKLLNKEYFTKYTIFTCNGLYIGGGLGGRAVECDIVTVTAERQAGVLDRPSCLAALAALRRTKWFQVCNRRYY